MGVGSRVAKACLFVFLGFVVVVFGSFCIMFLNSCRSFIFCFLFFVAYSRGWWFYKMLVIHDPKRCKYKRASE